MEELQSLSGALISKQDQLASLQLSILSAQKLSDMPRSSKSDNVRKIDNRVNRADILRRDIRHLEAAINLRISVIAENKLFIRDADMKIYLLLMRYIYGIDWGEILQGLFGEAEDFQRKRVAYKRRMFRLHRQACSDIFKWWDVRQKMVKPRLSREGGATNGQERKLENV